MRLMRTTTAAVLLGPLALPPAAPAQTTGQTTAAPGIAVVVDGTVAHGGTFDAGRLAGLPQRDLPAAGGAPGGDHRGVLLWDLLRQADPVEQPVKNPGLRHTVLVTGRDGYAVAFSFGELDPDGSADAVTLLTRNNALQLLVPADHTRRRNVHDVTRITVQ